jgi:hypothetical protein
VRALAEERSKKKESKDLIIVAVAFSSCERAVAGFRTIDETRYVSAKARNGDQVQVSGSPIRSWYRPNPSG